jgi:hypothetical protein
MSVIVGLASAYQGVVASDGRRFAPGRVEGGKVVQIGPMDSDEFDKTFAIGDGTVVGAFAGLMCFSGKDIGEHVREIFGNGNCAKAGFAGVVATVQKEMESRLSGSDEAEVVFRFRKLDLLLVAGKSLSRKEHQIAALRFFPRAGSIRSELELITPNGGLRFYVFGEDNARAAACRWLKANDSPNKSLTFLTTLASRAVKAGINKAGCHPDGGSQAACGGNIFTKSTRYK